MASLCSLSQGFYFHAFLFEYQWMSLCWPLRMSCQCRDQMILTHYFPPLIVFLLNMSQTLRLTWGGVTWYKHAKPSAKTNRFNRSQTAKCRTVMNCLLYKQPATQHFKQIKFWLSRTSCLKDSPSLPKRRARGLKSRHKGFQCLPGFLIFLCGRVQVVARHVNGHVNEICLVPNTHKDWSIGNASS